MTTINFEHDAPLDVEDHINDLIEIDLDERTPTRDMWYKRQQLASLKRSIGKAYEVPYTNLINEGRLDAMMPEYKRLKETLSTRPMPWNPWCHITWNPAPETDVQHLYKSFDKYIKTAMKRTNGALKNYIWCIEQNGADETTRGHHPHIHMFAMTTHKDRGQAMRFAKQFFSKYNIIGKIFLLNGCNYHHFNYWMGEKEGNKKGTNIPKMDAVAQDYPWREQHGFDRYLTNLTPSELHIPPANIALDAPD